MGSLDPKLDKERTFALLEKRGAISAVLKFSGGNDEGYDPVPRHDGRAR